MSDANPFLKSGGTQAQPATAQAAPMPGNSPSANVDFEVDLTDVQEGFAIPDGNYAVRCIDVEQSTSKAGNPMFVWSFVIIAGEFEGKDMKMWTSLAPAAMWKVAEAVKALGVGDVGQVVKFKRSDVIGRECGATISASEYQGKMSSKIDKLMSKEEYLQLGQ